MGKKGEQRDDYHSFGPSKTAVQQMQLSAQRGGPVLGSSYNVTPAKTDKWDWNAGKLDDAKWATNSNKPAGLTDCPSLTEICTRFIASNVQLYVSREDKHIVDKPLPHPTDPHFKIIPAASTTQTNNTKAKKYHGYTYAHLAGSLAYLPHELRDEVFIHALREGTLHYSQIPAYLHSFLRQLDLSKYGKDFHQSFVSYLVPKLGKIDTGDSDDWEHIDEWTIYEAYKGCPNLTFLDLSNCIILPHALQQVLSACPVQNLRLAHYPLHRNTTVEITTPLSSAKLEGLDIPFLSIPFVFDFPALSRIDLSYNRSNSPATLLSIAENSKRLTYLNISGTSNIIGFTQVMRSCHNLKYIVAKDNTLRMYDDLLLNSIPTKTLRSLNLSGNTGIHTDIIVNLAEKFENLRTLDVSHCPGAVERASEIAAQCLMVRPLLEIIFGTVPQPP